jgi:ABC-type multidrug transport system ATPase subunit
MAVTASALRLRRGRFRLAVDEFNAGAGGTALLGRNGAGKTTLLLALQGLIGYEGTVERPVHCAGVFAQPAVLRGSVLWNVAGILGAIDGRPAGASRERAHEMLARVGLSDALNWDARKLSSGQRQRLALARALALEPQALFLDEPFANVDADGRAPLRGLVRDYVGRSGCALVVATQNLTDALALCKVAVLLEGGNAVDGLDTRAIGASAHPYLRALAQESLPRAQPGN